MAADITTTTALALGPPPVIPTCRVLLMGAGVDTTAMLLLWHKRYAAVIFADTGSEEAATYDHIEKRLKPFCDEVGVPWVTVRATRPDPDHPRAGETVKAAREFTEARNRLGIPYSLEEHCIVRGILPIRTRRWCTETFKIRPINRWCKEAGGGTRDNPVVKEIGIAYDEAWRMAAFGVGDPSYVRLEAPLINARMTRADCSRTIEKHGWSNVGKSGCDFCMFKSRKQFRQLAGERPERFREIVAMEDAAIYKGHRPLLASGRLRSLIENDTLDRYAEGLEDAEAEQACTSGYCFG